MHGPKPLKPLTRPAYRSPKPRTTDYMGGYRATQRRTVHRDDDLEGYHFSQDGSKGRDSFTF